MPQTASASLTNSISTRAERLHGPKIPLTCLPSKGNVLSPSPTTHSIHLCFFKLRKPAEMSSGYSLQQDWVFYSCIVHVSSSD